MANNDEDANVQTEDDDDEKTVPFYVASIDSGVAEMPEKCTALVPLDETTLCALQGDNKLIFFAQKTGKCFPDIRFGDHGYKQVVRMAYDFSHARILVICTSPGREDDVVQNPEGKRDLVSIDVNNRKMSVLLSLHSWVAFDSGMCVDPVDGTIYMCGNGGVLRIQTDHIGAIDRLHIFGTTKDRAHVAIAAFNGRVFTLAESGHVNAFVRDKLKSASADAYVGFKHIGITAGGTLVLAGPGKKTCTKLSSASLTPLPELAVADFLPAAGITFEHVEGMCVHPLTNVLYAALSSFVCVLCI